MLANTVVNDLKGCQLLFNNSTHVLSEEDSTFKPSDEMYTVAQHVAHTAHALEWFATGAFSATGPIWDDDVMDQHNQMLERSTSLSNARAYLNRVFAEAIALFTGKSDDEILALLPETSVMGASPRLACVSGIRDHTAHHRGALTVYARLLGKTPLMPYMPPPEA